MLAAATRVLRLAFVTPAEAVDLTTEGPLVEFVAYARDATLAGTLRLTADRLTDLLNRADEIDLRDVLSIDHEGRVTELGQALIPRSDLIAVKAGEPRGNPRRRHRTRQTPAAAGAGPYHILGYLHGRPGADPLVHLGRRAPMVPLTDAVIR